ncbi:MAG: hypothetical protein DRG59_09855 [Deltaproteobacteria bacterium]|nr:MAG: hypothetical protein DRG59_09855 [Deltaproteobacteria bacterium]
MSKDRKGNWVYLGKKLEADVFYDLDSGKTIHIGTELTDGNTPKVYEGEPSLTGYIAGKILQGILGKTRRD